MSNIYEKTGVIYILLFVFFIWFIVSVFIFFNIKISKYKVFDCVVVKDDLVLLIINNADLELFYDNSCVFINDKKKRFLINKINKDVLKRNNVFYSEVYFTISFSNKKENDVIRISVLEEKVNIFDIFRVIWR